MILLTEPEVIKKFSGNKLDFIATTTDVGEVNKLLSEGWGIKDTTSFPTQTQIGGLAIITLFVLVKPKGKFSG